MILLNPLCPASAGFACPRRFAAREEKRAGHAEATAGVLLKSFFSL